MSGDLLLALCTCPDEALAGRIAQALVEARLAACVNLLPGVRSIYRWQQRVEDDREILLLIKTARHQLPALRTKLSTLHPYEVPELVTLAIDDGLPEYLTWWQESLGKP